MSTATPSVQQCIIGIPTLYLPVANRAVLTESALRLLNYGQILRMVLFRESLGTSSSDSYLEIEMLGSSNQFCPLQWLIGILGSGFL